MILFLVIKIFIKLIRLKIAKRFKRFEALILSGTDKFKQKIFAAAVPVEPMLIAKSSAFKNPVTQEFGLKDKNNNICLLLKFTAKLINTNLEGSNIATKVSYFCYIICYRLLLTA